MGDFVLRDGRLYLVTAELSGGRLKTARLSLWARLRLRLSFLSWAIVGRLRGH